MMDDKSGKALTISVPDAGVLVGVGRVRAYECARTGEIPTIRFGRAMRVPVGRLAEILGVTSDEIWQRLDAEANP